MKYFILLSLLLINVGNAFGDGHKRVLMVLSSNGQQQGEVQPGYEFDEFAKAYLVFEQHGIEVDIASPKGGKLEADKYDTNKPFNAKVIANKVIMHKLANTLATKNIDSSRYDGVFVVGGKGAMFDLPKDKDLQSIIADVYQQQGTIAAVCHGPAALVNVKLSNGDFLVAGKNVNAFTNEEERLFGKKWMGQFEFMLEDKLKSRGGVFESSDIMLDHVAVDSRLVTGQNPSSTVSVALALLESMGVQTKQVERFIDDSTLALIARLLNGNYDAVKDLTLRPNDYQIELVGMYGYYYLRKSNVEQEYKNALMLMNLARSAIENPMLDVQIAKAYQYLGDVQSAAVTLNQVLANKPDFAPASELLNTLMM